MSYKRYKDVKKIKGGERPPTPLDVLLVTDSFHDFWNCDRGQFKGDDRLKAILNYGLIEETSKYTGINVQMSGSPYIAKQGTRAIIAEYQNLTPIANHLFSLFPAPLNTINVSDVELTAEKAFNNPIASSVFQLSDNDLANGNNEIFLNIVKTALGGSYVEEDDVHILCDAGFGNIGKVGKTSGKLRGIITPQVIGDSANTSIKPIGHKSNIYYAPETTEGTNTFISDSNCFTREDGYTVGYINNGINDNNPYSFSLVISKEGQSLKAEFSSKTNTGPSAALLGGCFIVKYLQSKGDPELVYNAQQISSDLEKRLRGAGGKSFRATSNVLDIWTSFNTVHNPYLFIDLKRGGDRDQVKAAVLASQKFNNLIFCTGDLLCAVAAIKNGLPTIYQLPKTSSTPAVISVWTKGIGITSIQFGGNPQQQQIMSQIYSVGSQIDKLSEEEFLSVEQGLTIEDLIRDAAAQASAYLKTLLSTHYPILYEYVLVQNVILEMNNLQVKSKIINIQMLEPLNQTIKSFNILKSNSIPPVSSSQTLVEYITKFTDYSNTLEATLKTPEEVKKQAQLRIQFLEADTKEFNLDLLSFLMDKYDVKFPTGSSESELFNYIKTILNPYSDDGHIKLAHPAVERVTSTKIGSKNLYICGLLTLSLINDFIDNSFGNKTSVITNLLFGSSYSKRNTKPLNSTTLQIYSNAIININRSILLSQNGNPLVPGEVIGLVLTGGKHRHKTLRRYKKIKHRKTQYKRK